jgi:4-hydroxybenzoate polyprenyltransferase
MNFQQFKTLIMIEQTLFALPFAYMGILFAGGGGWQVWLWSTTALFGARTAGMSFNRILDAEIDGKNPRTSSRLIPSGKVTKISVWIVAILSSLFLVFSAWMLNALVFYLSFAALFLLFTYSFFKRFSSSSHFYLGIVEAAAPIGGFLAATGSWQWECLLPGGAILFWIAGLDILYAFQDTQFDREEGLHSIPARLGESNARRISLASYLASIIILVVAGYFSKMGILYFAGILVVSIIMTRQQLIAFRAEGGTVEALKEVFSLNRFISPVIFAAALADWLTRRFIG